MTIETSDFSVDDAANAFLSSWGTADALEEPEVTEQAPDAVEDTPETQDTDEPETEEGSETEEDGAQEEEAPETEEDPDALEVEVTLGEEVQKVTLRDLKDRFIKAQEVEKTQAAITEAKAKVEADGAKYAAGLERMFKAAEDRFKPYAEADDLVLMKELSAEAFAQYRKDKQEAYNEYAFLKGELDNTVQSFRARQQETLREQAAQAIKVLTDPKDGIPGWNEVLYNDIRAFAVERGMAAQVVNNLVDPAAIKILHDAMLYRKAQKASTEKVVKKTIVPKKVLKTTTPVTNTPASKPAKAQALNQLRKSGSIDDAANAFLAGWSED